MLLMRQFGAQILLCLLIFGLPLQAQAAPDFPDLSGRVVDGGNVLKLATETALNSRLQAHENANSNQIVVVSLNGLQGYDISDFGYRLGRHWRLGHKDRDNGVLLIIAPVERKVRIDVGYGLEGSLTDALSRNIIQTQIIPHFRQGDYDAGVSAGVDAIIAAIEGVYEPVANEQSQWTPLLMFLLFGVVMYLMSRHSERFYGNSPGRYGSRRRSNRFPGDDGFGGPGGFGGGGGLGGMGGFGGGGGFSGGGGGFGGGGASGGW